MKKLLALIAIAVTLTACSKTETTPAAAAVEPAAATAPAASAASSATSAAPATPATPATTPTPTPTPTPTTASADIPKECQDYLDKVSACAGKQHGAAGDAIKASMEQTKAAWASMGADKATLSAACKAVNDAFVQQAAAMKC
jgi:hypothetical protein